MSYGEVLHALVVLVGCGVTVWVTWFCLWYCFWLGLARGLGGVVVVLLWLVGAIVLPWVMFSAVDQFLYFSRRISAWRTLLWLVSFVLAGLWVSFRRNRRCYV